MIVMARDRDYGDLLGDLGGRRVLVWTCNTCARFCDGLGGREAADALASRLAEDGVDVAGVVSSGACCFMRNARRMAEGQSGYDTVLALCCDNGAADAREATGADVLNPVVTLGPGYLDDGGRPRVARVLDGRRVSDEGIDEAAGRAGCLTGPFVPYTHAQ